MGIMNSDKKKARQKRSMHSRRIMWTQAFQSYSLKQHSVGGVRGKRVGGRKDLDFSKVTYFLLNNFIYGLTITQWAASNVICNFLASTKFWKDLQPLMIAEVSRLGSHQSKYWAASESLIRT